MQVGFEMPRTMLIARHSCICWREWGKELSFKNASDSIFLSLVNPPFSKRDCSNSAFFGNLRGLQQGDPLSVAFQLGYKGFG